MLDVNSDKSIYIQIAETIENEILTGNLKEGEQAPSTNQFAKVYKINPATAGKGLNILADEGILYKKRGLGMFIADGAKEMIMKKRQDTFFEEAIPKLVREAERLGINISDVIKIIKEYKGAENK